MSRRRLPSNSPFITPAEQPVNAEIHFPVLHGLQLGAAEDLQCFFPQYRNALGGDRATYYAYAGVAFPMQFFDVFDERSGGGVWLRTEDRAEPTAQLLPLEAGRRRASARRVSGPHHPVRFGRADGVSRHAAGFPRRRLARLRAALP